MATAAACAALAALPTTGQPPPRLSFHGTATLTRLHPSVDEAGNPCTRRSPSGGRGVFDARFADGAASVSIRIPGHPDVWLGREAEGPSWGVHPVFGPYERPDSATDSRDLGALGERRLLLLLASDVATLVGTYDASEGDGRPTLRLRTDGGASDPDVLELDRAQRLASAVIYAEEPDGFPCRHELTFAGWSEEEGRLHPTEITWRAPGAREYALRVEDWRPDSRARAPETFGLPARFESAMRAFDLARRQSRIAAWVTLVPGDVDPAAAASPTAPRWLVSWHFGRDDGLTDSIAKLDARLETDTTLRAPDGVPLAATAAVTAREVWFDPTRGRGDSPPRERRLVRLLRAVRPLAPGGR